MTDQQTTNLIAVIKVITIAAVALGGMLAVVILAALRDGEYGTLLVQWFPPIIISSIGAIFGKSVSDSLFSYLGQRVQATTLQTIAAPNPVTPPAVTVVNPPSAPVPVVSAAPGEGVTP